MFSLGPPNDFLQYQFTLITECHGNSLTITTIDSGSEISEWNRIHKRDGCGVTQKNERLRTVHEVS